MSMMGMSNEEVRSFNQAIIEEFRANGGTCGGPLAGNPMLLLTMTGAKTGRKLTTPLTYHPDGDDFVVMASAGGSPTHPGWCYNLAANPNVIVEVGAERFEVSAIQTEGQERARVFTNMTTAMPRFGDYQAAVNREIPLFKLTRK